MPETKPRYVPKRCVFEATLACNLNCRHCGSRAGRSRPDELTTAEATDLFFQLAALGGERVTIAGGEPMTRGDWPELIAAAARSGLRVGMLTNGLAFDDAAARLAREAGLNAVGFSLDGPREVHDRMRGKVGHFARLGAAMDAAVRAGLPFAVVSFVHAENLARLDEMHDYVRGKGAFAWQVQLGTDMGNLHDHPELLIRPRQLPDLERKIAALVRRGELRIDVSDSIGYFGPHERVLRRSTGRRSFSGCGAGLRVIGIESNGNVKGCLSIMAGYNEQGAAFVEGNIRQEPLAAIWNREGAFAYNRAWSRESLAGFCRECEHAEHCRGGCRAKMVASGGGMENPFCASRVLADEERSPRRAGQAAAAAVLAAVLGGTANACYESEEDSGRRDGGGDAAADASDADTDTDTDTDVDTDTDTDTDADSDTDTSSTDYGMPDDGSVTDYDTPEYAMPQDGSVDMYNMPPDEK